MNRTEHEQQMGLGAARHTPIGSGKPIVGPKDAAPLTPHGPQASHAPSSMPTQGTDTAPQDHSLGASATGKQAHARYCTVRPVGQIEPHDGHQAQEGLRGTGEAGPHMVSQKPEASSY